MLLITELMIRGLDGVRRIQAAVAISQGNTHIHAVSTFVFLLR